MRKTALFALPKMSVNSAEQNSSKLFHLCFLTMKQDGIFFCLSFVLFIK